MPGGGEGREPLPPTPPQAPSRRGLRRPAHALASRDLWVVRVQGGPRIYDVNAERVHDPADPDATVKLDLVAHVRRQAMD